VLNTENSRKLPTKKNKLLPLTSQTKLTLIVTLTLTDTVMPISQTKLGG